MSNVLKGFLCAVGCENVVIVLAVQGLALYDENCMRLYNHMYFLCVGNWAILGLSRSTVVVLSSGMVGGLKVRY